MTAQSRCLKVFASIALVVMTCAGLASCRGGGSGPIASDGGKIASDGGKIASDGGKIVSGTAETTSDGSKIAPARVGAELIITPATRRTASVRSRQTSPDLVVGSPTVSDDGPGPGASFTFSATVSNAGDGESPATTLRYYRSEDATITPSDTAVGTADIGVLSAAGTSAKSISLTAPSRAGPYYYAACVDEVTDESNTANNCSSSVEVTVLQTLQQQGGLVARTPGVSRTNPHPIYSNVLWLTTRVTNTGETKSGAAQLRFYRSRDATITTSDTFLPGASIGQPSTTPIPALTPGRYKDVEFWTSTPQTPGIYYYGACVDEVLDDSDATDNCSSSVKVTVQTPDPIDLEIVKGSTTTSNSEPATGARFTLSATVRNAGELEADVSSMTFYRSTDAEISTSDTVVGSGSIGRLGGGWIHTGSVTLRAPEPDSYYYGVCVWSRDESDYTNNCSSTGLVVTVGPARQGPDLVIPTLSYQGNSDGLPPGATLLIRVQVRNEGDTASPAGTVKINLSNREVASGSVGALNSGASVFTDWISVRLPDLIGYYHYRACVDGVAGESDTTNNCWNRSVAITVRR